MDVSAGANVSKRKARYMSELIAAVIGKLILYEGRGYNG